MQFINTILFAAAALASMASAQENLILFQNKDGIAKTIKFTPNAGVEPIEPLPLPGSGTATQIFPPHWEGNFYSYSEGAPDVAGMLGEVNFQGWNGLTYYDVSSIVNTDDTAGIKLLYPKSGNYPADIAKASGCAQSLANEFGKTTGCTNQYNAPNDIATVSTELTALICEVGTATIPLRRRRVSPFSRDYLTGVVA